MLKVLASDLTRGNNDFGMWPIEKVNGEKFVDFNDFYQKMQNSTQKYIVLEDEDGVKVIIDKDEGKIYLGDSITKGGIELAKIPENYVIKDDLSIYEKKDNLKSLAYQKTVDLNILNLS